MKCLGFALLACSFLATLPCAADEAPTTAAVVPPDVVLLKNGGMLRGTISELVPGEFVAITIGSGEVRKLPMSDVRYAGPASQMPAAQTAPETDSETKANAADASEAEAAAEPQPKRAARGPRPKQSQKAEV